MGLFTFILIVQTLVAIVMITVILMQRSEAGGLAGGSPSGLMTARGASDFLSRTTAISATLFVGLSILLAAVAARQGGPREIDPSLFKAPPAGAPATSAPAAPTQTAPAQGAETNQSGVPLAQ